MVEYKAERDVNLEVSKGEKENMYIASMFEIMKELIASIFFTRKKSRLTTLHPKIKINTNGYDMQSLLSSVIVECYGSHGSHSAMGYCYFAHPVIHTMLRHGGKNSLRTFLS